MALDKSPRCGLVDQQMHVLRHDDVTGNHKEITEANALQRIFKEFHGRDRRQVGTTAITTEGEEVELPRLLIADALRLSCTARLLQFLRSTSPRSPNARDRGHPHRGLGRSPGPGPTSPLTARLPPKRRPAGCNGDLLRSGCIAGCARKVPDRDVDASALDCLKIETRVCFIRNFQMRWTQPFHLQIDIFFVLGKQENLDWSLRTFARPQRNDGLQTGGSWATILVRPGDCMPLPIWR